MARTPRRGTSHRKSSADTQTERWTERSISTSTLVPFWTICTEIHPSGRLTLELKRPFLASSFILGKGQEIKRLKVSIDYSLLSCFK